MPVAELRFSPTGCPTELILGLAILPAVQTDGSLSVCLWGQRFSLRSMFPRRCIAKMAFWGARKLKRLKEWWMPSLLLRFVRARLSTHGRANRKAVGRVGNGVLGQG